MSARTYWRAFRQSFRISAWLAYECVRALVRMRGKWTPYK